MRHNRHRHRAHRRALWTLFLFHQTERQKFRIYKHPSRASLCYEASIDWLARGTDHLRKKELARMLGYARK